MGRYAGRLFVTAKEIESGAVPVESELDQTSVNPVQNGVVARAIQALKDLFDGESKKLKKQYLPDGVPTEVDDKLSSTSTNPVQNKVLHQEIGKLNNVASGSSTTARLATEKAESALSAAYSAGSKGSEAVNAINYQIKPTLDDHEERLDDLEAVAGSIENALSEIRALQASYIGGAE